MVFIPRTPISLQPSITHHARATSSSETASLHGKPAKTPIIAGSVCGGILLIAWIIGFTIYFRKRYNRQKRKRAAVVAGMTPPEVKSRPETEKVVIPPDPAVLLGQRQPGYAFREANATHGTVAEKDGADEGKDVGNEHPISGGGSDVGPSRFGASDERGRVEEQRPLLSAMTGVPDISALNRYPPTGRRVETTSW